MRRGAAIAAALALLLMPQLLPPYDLYVLSSALAFAIGCLGLNLLFGHTGLLSFGQAAYFGVGAYAGGFLYTFSPVSSFEVYLATGVLASTALATVFGFLCVQATRIHFTILTLAFAQMVHSLFISGMIFNLFGVAGKGLFLEGGGGLYIPRLTVGGTEFAPGAFETMLYYVILIAFAGSLLLGWRIVNSPFGKALNAIRDSETRAACIGIPVRRYRWLAFIIAGVFTGLAGGLSAQLHRQVTPGHLHWVFSAKMVLATVLGGPRHFLGPVLGALAFTAFEEVALRFTLYRNLVLGVLLIATILALPGGLTGGAIAVRGRLRRLGFDIRRPRDL